MAKYSLLLCLLACAASFAVAAESTTPKPKDEFKDHEDQKGAALDALRKGNSASADQLLKAAARGTPESAAWNLDYADLLIAAACDLKERNAHGGSVDYFQQAVQAMEKALKGKDAPTSPAALADAYYKLGFIARFSQGDEKKATDYFLKAVESDPTYEVGRNALQRTKEGRQALSDLDKQNAQKGKKTDGG